MNKWPLTFLLLGINLFSFSLLAQTRDAELVDFSESQNFQFCQRKTQHVERAHSYITFNKKDKLVLNESSSLSYRFPLFVGVQILVNRPISSFGTDKLLTPADIEYFSKSSLHNVSRVPNGLHFTSHKSLPDFSVLKCDNHLSLMEYEEFKNLNIFKKTLYHLLKENCIDPSHVGKISLQKVHSCNHTFQNSYIITFFSKASNKQTRIITLTFSDFKEAPGMMTRYFARNKIESELEEIPRLIKDLE